MKKEKRSGIVLGIVCCMVLSPCACFSQFATYSNEFLNIGAGARGMAMGNEQVASADDATAGYWNPAGLAQVKDNPQIALMHSEYFAGIGKYDFGALALPIDDNKRTLGLTFLRFGVDDIPNTLFLVNPDGSVDYNNVQSFSSADYAVLFSFAQQLPMIKESQTASFGFNVKIIRRVVGSFANAWGFGLDAGFQMATDRWKVGIVARDFTSTFNAWAFSFTDAEKQRLYAADNIIPSKSTELTAPSSIIGVGYKFFNPEKAFHIMAEIGANITFDGIRNTVAHINDMSIDPHVGVEFSLKDIFFVRAGVTNIQQAISDEDTTNQQKKWIYQPSIGAGFRIKQVSIDYAFTNLANQSNPLYTNVFSLKLNLVRKQKSTL